MTHQVIQPPGWPRPKGYSNGVLARGATLFIAGQCGWDANQKFVAPRLAPQVRQALINIVSVLTAAGGRVEHLTRLTWYVTSRDAYYAELAEIGAAYREIIGKHFPVMAVMQVIALMEAEALVEIEATAVVPDA